MKRAYYSDAIADFLRRDEDAILGGLAANCPHDIDHAQNIAWREQIRILKSVLAPYGGRGKLYLEYTVPRLGGRIDALILIDHVIFVVEFKVGAQSFAAHAVNQVWDYALDLKNFHETSHAPFIAPILAATNAPAAYAVIQISGDDNVLRPVCANNETIAETMRGILDFADGDAIAAEKWECGRYRPTPTIIEAATALYGGHSVHEISRNDAGAKNLGETSDAIIKIINAARENSYKAICFITGVPGAGKTLVGLDVATRRGGDRAHGVFLSGNAPLVNVLCEALARDKIRRNAAEHKPRQTKGRVRAEVKMFVQNVHHFRDECLVDKSPPHEHVALFDEAQRAWDREQTSNFMRRKKGKTGFDKSEPEFLISCLDRHADWAVVVCLVGGGQEIKIGEAGIGGWIEAVADKFPHWRAYISPHLRDGEYAAGNALAELRRGVKNVNESAAMHLTSSMRSFRSEHVARLVKELLDSDVAAARKTLSEIGDKYPIVLTRDLRTAKEWVRKRARGSERYGMVVSSQAERLRPYAIDVRPRIDPVHWFLDGRDDVRSSYYLEDVATEFEIQGLEVDWACLTWDADFRRTAHGWENWAFRGSRWQRIRKPENQVYQKNAYRVLLTRARQGMVIVVPEGDNADPTRAKAFYDPIFAYLCSIGFIVI